MTTVDMTKLSYTELLSLSEKLDQEIAAKRTEELKVLADGFAKKVVAAGFSVDEAMSALRPYVEPSKTGRRKSPGKRPALYQDPANPANTWSGRGLPARWLTTYEQQGRGREEFRIAP